MTPAFRYLVAGRFVTMLGNSVAPIALAFAVLDLTGSVRDLGLVVGARSLMNVLFLLVGGVVADRFARQWVMVVSGVLAALTQAAVAAMVLSASATIGWLITLSALNGIVSAFAFPAAAALVPQTVAPQYLQQANAINRIGMNTAMILGAALGGVLVASVGPGWGLALDAATFAVAAILFSLVRLERLAPSEKTGSPLRDLRDGWREFVSHEWLWRVVLGFSLMNLGHAAALTVLGPAVADGGFGRQGWGLIMAAETVGMVVGGLIAMRIRVNRLLRFGIICMFGEIPLVLALAEEPRVAVLMPAALIAGVAFEQFSVAWETTMQRYIPGEMLARVYSYDALGSFIAIPLGQVLAGPAALAWGTDTALIVTAGLSVAAVLFMLSSRDVRTLPAQREPVMSTHGFDSVP